MKTVKLKPLFFPNDDILVKPPNFIEIAEETQIVNKNKTFSNTDQLKVILKGRRSKKQAVKVDDEEETVKRLEDWKAPESPKSPLRKKFTFRRGITSRENSEVMRNKPKNLQMTLIPVSVIDSVANVFRSIVAVERLKKKSLDAESKRITEANLALELSVKGKIMKVANQLEGIKAYLRENLAKLEELKVSLEGVEAENEEKMHEIGLNEAQELLFSEKGKKRTVRAGEESQYFIKKEKFRQAKQEIHKKYQDDKEFYAQAISKTQVSIRSTEALRVDCKKNLKLYREELTQLYCRALRDAQDIRSDGLRWVIKSLWKLNECVPVSAFPKFFDEDSCHFLVFIAEKDLELEKFTLKLDDMRKELKKRKNSYSIKTTRELYKNIRSRLKMLSQSSIGEDLRRSPPNEFGFVERGLDESMTHPGNYAELSVIRDKITEISEFIRDYTNQEIKRITDNYQNSPGKAESVGLFHLIRCLVGDRVREFNKYTRASKMNNRVRPTSKGLV